MGIIDSCVVCVPDGLVVAVMVVEPTGEVVQVAFIDAEPEFVVDEVRVAVSV